VYAFYKYVFIHICIHIYIYICIYMYTYICICNKMYTYMQVNVYYDIHSKFYANTHTHNRSNQYDFAQQMPLFERPYIYEKCANRYIHTQIHAYAYKTANIYLYVYIYPISNQCNSCATNATVWSPVYVLPIRLHGSGSFAAVVPIPRIILKFLYQIFQPLII
jgi:hypothetical protein